MYVSLQRTTSRWIIIACLFVGRVFFFYHNDDDFYGSIPALSEDVGGSDLKTLSLFLLPSGLAGGGFGGRRKVELLIEQREEMMISICGQHVATCKIVHFIFSVNFFNMFLAITFSDLVHLRKSLLINSKHSGPIRGNLPYLVRIICII